jgi:hypothetical protein
VRLRRAVLLLVARMVSARVRGLRQELEVQRQRRQADASRQRRHIAEMMAEHEARVRALNARVDVLRSDADRAVHTCDMWRGLHDDVQARHRVELERGNELNRLLGAIANVADDPAMPADLAARIRGLAGRTEQHANDENKVLSWDNGEDVRA